MQQIAHVLEHRRDIDGFARELLLAREGEHPLGQRGTAPDPLARIVEQAHNLRIGRGQPLVDKVEAGLHRHQHIVEIVRDPAGDLAERFHLLRLEQRLFGGEQLGGALGDAALERSVEATQLVLAVAQPAVGQVAFERQRDRLGDPADERMLLFLRLARLAKIDGEGPQQATIGGADRGRPAGAHPRLGGQVAKILPQGVLLDVDDMDRAAPRRRRPARADALADRDPVDRGVIVIGQAWRGAVPQVFAVVRQQQHRGQHRGILGLDRAQEVLEHGVDRVAGRDRGQNPSLLLDERHHLIGAALEIASGHPTNIGGQPAFTNHFVRLGAVRAARPRCPRYASAGRRLAAAWRNAPWQRQEQAGHGAGGQADQRGRIGAEQRSQQRASPEDGRRRRVGAPQEGERAEEQGKQIQRDGGDR
ncbi:hypothetical protein L8951_02920 [Sphingomicrobium astaxanthinifaciens]|nr:hypothetical protein [Sphingomicrobium astaxanthinifaciens]MCJ7420764.1 hypothetical protein [Sphingomicrobium astaxanthinifaciens]